MATISLPFPANSINASLQVGDVVFSCVPTTTGQFNFENNSTDINLLGSCSGITHTSTNSFIEVDTGDVGITLPSSGDFVLFSKDGQANISSLVGYFAEAKFVNNSKTQAELFSIASLVSESSK